MDKIAISLTGFDPKPIWRGVKKIKQQAEFLTQGPLLVSTFPAKSKKYTLLRSPHIDKKSREQFVLKTFKTGINLHVEERAFTVLFYSFMAQSEFPGVEIQFSVEFNGFLSPRNAPSVHELFPRR